MHVSGSKNACLPIVVACSLTDHACEIARVPHLQDSASMLGIMGQLGAEVYLLDGQRVSINARTIKRFDADEELVRSMRASILLLGPLLAHYGQVKLPLPGGCAIGDRPIDVHVQGLKAMGASVDIEGSTIIGAAPNGLRGTEYHFPTVSVTGTENLLMAATLAQGTSVLHNCAHEPEIVDLAHFLRAMGAHIQGEGTSTIEITGVSELAGVRHDIIADRIEAGTFLCAAIATRGAIRLQKIQPSTIANLIEVIERMGFTVEVTDDEVFLDARTTAGRAIDIVTAPYPGFPTDMQAQFCVLNCLLSGTATITDTVFEGRFLYTKELQKMNARVGIDGNKCHTEGSDSLQGASLVATDLRASASLVIAALAAQGESVIEQIYHLDRGYETIEEKLARLGASVTRKSVHYAYNSPS